MEPETEAETETGPPLGIVPVEGRGSLPFALVHGESLVAAASWALTTAEVELVDLATSYDQLRESGRTLVVHDPLCPLTPAHFLSAAIEESVASGAVVVGVREVTDTVKEVIGPTSPGEGARLGGTRPREELMCVTSPVVLPPAVVAALDGLALDDLPAWVDDLARRFPVRFLPAPSLSRRIGSQDDLGVLEALSRTDRG